MAEYGEKVLLFQAFRIRAVEWRSYFQHTEPSPVLKTNPDSFWIHCPACNSKTQTKVYEDTVLLNFPLFCPKCRKEYVINVVQLKMQVI